MAMDTLAPTTEDTPNLGGDDLVIQILTEQVFTFEKDEGEGMDLFVAAGVQKRRSKKRH